MGNEIRNPVLRFVVYGHVLLAAGAALQVWWIGDQWFVEGSWNRSAAAFFAAMAFYGLTRLIRAKDDALKEVPLFIWYRSNAKAMGAVVAVCALLAMLCLHDELVEVLTRMLPVIIPAVLYVTPLRAGGRAIGLRSVPGLKSLVVAWVWAAGTVLLSKGDWQSGNPAPLVGVMALFYLAIAIAFDCRDADLDDRSLRTLPQMIGSKAARILALLFLLPFAWMFWVEEALVVSPERYWFMPVPAIALLVPALLILRSSPSRSSLHWLLLDCCIALIPASALLGEGL